MARKAHKTTWISKKMVGNNTKMIGIYQKVVGTIKKMVRMDKKMARTCVRAIFLSILCKFNTKSVHYLPFRC